MWNPLRRKKITPVLVSDATPAPLPDQNIEQATEAAALRSLVARHQVKALASQIHEQLAAGVLLELRGGSR